ncbi:DeoR/GlpR family DNA-binding transcription regulator [Aquincola sp. J276]|uniref:DeoR/GlpR family DNA-binding transcription regulator n=1 Tax=Aquincola sp. J276 TaxID=2898432 RepID=UPI00215094BA|nr:DeoR/GlpR family DNA-binding transcription regulator [Aquincola sp. J276]MCR5863796.1 DeoR/GlpR family DNA-binding transcription regulator [Aquincola sp. J276]
MIMHTPPPSPAADDLPRFAQERQQRIAELLKTRGRVEVAPLAAQYGVSDDTIRRDLRQLAARGLVQKTHGGAVALNTGVMSSQQRAAVMPGVKQALARTAVGLVQPHQTLFIDGGSTMLALAHQLRADDAPRPITVVTHSLDVFLTLADAPQVRPVLAGGHWLPEHRVFEGEQALATLQAHRADIAFLGACALHERTGVTAWQPGDAAIKRAMVRGAVRRVVLCDASKLDQVAPCAVAELAELDHIVTDAEHAFLAGRRLPPMGQKN